MLSKRHGICGIMAVLHEALTKLQMLTLTAVSSCTRRDSAGSCTAVQPRTYSQIEESITILQQIPTDQFPSSNPCFLPIRQSLKMEENELAQCLRAWTLYAERSLGSSVPSSTSGRL